MQTIGARRIILAIYYLRSLPVKKGEARGPFTRKQAPWSRRELDRKRSSRRGTRMDLEHVPAGAPARGA